MAGYSDGELRAMYRDAKDKKLQIRILSELSLRPEAEIKELVKDITPPPVKKTPRKPRYRPVICLDDGRTFSMVEDAARFYGVLSSGITNACRGVHNTCGGRHFAYLGGKHEEID